MDWQLFEVALLKEMHVGLVVGTVRLDAACCPSTTPLVGQSQRKGARPEIELAMEHVEGARCLFLIEQHTFNTVQFRKANTHPGRALMGSNRRMLGITPVRLIASHQQNITSSP